MVALVGVETLLLVLLTLLVAGLLRSHAEILRRLGPPDAGGGRLPEPGARGGGAEARDVAGATLAGDAVMIGLGEGSPPTLLAFLSSGCAICDHLWAQLRTHRPDGLPAAVRLVTVVKDADAESLARLRALAPAAVPLVLSSAAWRDYSVPATPYFVYLEGGRVQGEGSASSWDQIQSLLRDAYVDARQRNGSTDDVECALAGAGIDPGHPSLYPAGRPGEAGQR
ncbi:MAG TPA: hypothetical protein VMA77_01855 [Solirubrobacteraceae bacterium]|nr:hypothetical protein [Solirubrobacteraceae bacterium]